jgi:hypothetical protein
MNVTLKASVRDIIVFKRHYGPCRHCGKSFEKRALGPCTCGADGLACCPHCGAPVDVLNPLTAKSA